eukprot:2838814-Pleurochrysis_carterae.AAC.1
MGPTCPAVIPLRSSAAHQLAHGAAEHDGMAGRPGATPSPVLAPSGDPARGQGHGVHDGVTPGWL